MNEPKRKKIKSIPLRMDLPEELAALAIPGDEQGDETVVLNTSETPAQAWADLRFGLILALLGWLADQGWRWLRDHKAVVMSVGATATVTTGAIIGIDTARDGNGTPIAQPQPTITIVATATVTPSSRSPRPSPTPPRTPPRTPPALVVTPPETRSTGRDSTSPAEPSRTPPATVRPERSSDPEASPETSAPPGSGSTPDTVSEPPDVVPDSPTAAPPTTSAPEPQPTVTSAARDCVLDVDIDPILDLCLLG